MAEPTRRIAVVWVSDSFRTAVAELASELGVGLAEAEAGPVVDPLATLIMAGGMEPDGLERLGEPGRATGPRFLVGAATDHRVGAGAVRLGAVDYFALPADLDLMRRTLERLVREAEMPDRASAFASGERDTTGFGAMIGRSPLLRQVLEHGRRVALHRDVTVLIGGETGTGKELLARAIHYESPRARAPFVEINCAAIPANLLESELFGHEKGAFTGAVAAKAGLLELADGGTVFLDEIGNLPLELQPKILRALETREIRRVGGSVSRSIDIRLISATHVDLAAAVRAGGFREDLYYRLNVVALVLPPLREREGDVELLAETFARQLAAAYGLPAPELGPDVRLALRSHSWPGNIRELRNAVERALVLSPPGTLELPELLTAPPRGGSHRSDALPFPAPLDTIIRAAALAMLDRTGGNKSETARRLGISRPRLQRILDGEAD